MKILSLMLAALLLVGFSNDDCDGVDTPRPDCDAPESPCCIRRTFIGDDCVYECQTDERCRARQSSFEGPPTVFVYSALACGVEVGAGGSGEPEFLRDDAGNGLLCPPDAGQETPGDATSPDPDLGLDLAPDQGVQGLQEPADHQMRR